MVLLRHRPPGDIATVLGGQPYRRPQRDRVDNVICWAIKHRCRLLLVYLAALFVTIIVLAPGRLSQTPNHYLAILNSSGYILLPRKGCGDAGPFVVILVSVSPEQRQARGVIRSTWAGVTRASHRLIKTVFLLGDGHDQKIQAALAIEHAAFDDLVQKDFFDSYLNLTLKTLMGFQWVSEHCPRAEYIMKTDSDVFVNVWRLVHLLLAAADLPVPLYTGKIRTADKPIRNPSNKYSISWAEYPEKVFPPYCPGWSYILSTDLVPALLAVVPTLPPLKLEDVFVGLCLEHLGIKPMSLGQLGTFLEHMVQNICLYRSVVASHGLRPDIMHAVWTAIHRSGRRRCSFKTHLGQWRREREDTKEFG
ncbi:beta-1,3-galactosyltransferase 5-like [Ambystoma mexicanum]|uniref:beta-1,3-galactosyltransferase 5-like n=1 Tax=Ambystoma mexicanum TaxID=8296 RepID=UPI0037E90425